MNWNSVNVMLRRSLCIQSLCIGAVVLACSTVRADPPSTRPFRDGTAGGNPRGAVGGADRRQEPSPAEISSAIEFFSTISPNRMSLFKVLPDESPRRRMVANDLARRYRVIQGFKETSPELYDLLVQQVKLRDDAFKLAKDGDTAGLHDKATVIVDLALKTRHLRLDLLQKEIAGQQQQLATDESDPSKLVTDEAANVKEDFERLSRAARFHNRATMNDDVADPLADAAPFTAPDPDSK